MREQLYAMEETALLAYLDQLENASTAEIKLAAQIFPRAQPVVPDTFSRRVAGAPEEEDSTDGIYSEVEEEARITIEGPLSMSGPSPLARLFGLSGTSYRAIAAACNKAEASACTSVAFAINSPGGEVAGVDQVWQSIVSLAGKKPCTAENHGMCASAAYWLASACPKIVAMSPACEQGSIGVKIVAIDDTASMESSGRKRITIVSKNAPRKDPDVYSASGRDELQKRADAMEAVFHARVAEGRGVSVDHVKKNFGAGALMIAGDAIDVKMIDDIISRKPEAIAPPADSMSRMIGMSAEAILEAPYPTEHACRITSPTGKKFRRANGDRKHGGKSYDVIYQEGKDGKWEEQAYRYPKEHWSAESASSHCKSHGGAFEAAKTAKAQGVNHMTLAEILSQNPEARSEYDKAIAEAKVAGRAEMQAVAKKVGVYLTSEVYSKSKPIIERALKAIAGEASIETVEAAVSMFDLMAEDKKQTAAAAEQTEQPETPGQVIAAGVDLLAKALALKIDVKAVEASALAAKMDPVKALEAEIQNQELLAKDRERMAV